MRFLDYHLVRNFHEVNLLINLFLMGYNLIPLYSIKSFVVTKNV